MKQFAVSAYLCVVAEKRKYRSSYVSSVLSVALVLFLIGLLAVLVFQARKLSTHFKESLELSIFLKEDVSETAVEGFREKLQTLPFTKSTVYISKEQAAADFSTEYDADVLNDNPLPASISLYLHARYAVKDSIEQLIPVLEKEREVSEVVYHEALLNLVNNNINKIGLYLLIGGLVFLLIAFTLIDSAIRLAMYSKRFLIKSMQLVGATNSFILRPYLQRSVFNGIVSAALAIAGLLALYYYFTKNYPLLFSSAEFSFFGIIWVGLILLGMVISLFSTWVAVKKYLYKKIEDLY